MKLHLLVAAVAAFALAACGKEPAPAPKKEEPKKEEVKAEEKKDAPNTDAKQDPVKPGK